MLIEFSTDIHIDIYCFTIVGLQKKRIRCTWGGKACDDFNNVDETKAYCNQFDVRLFFCTSFKEHKSRKVQRFSQYDEINNRLRYMDDYPWRNFRYANFRNGRHALNIYFSKLLNGNIFIFSAFSSESWENCVTVENVQRCDNDYWSMCTEMNPKSKQRLRYCLFREKQCILEESRIDDRSLDSNSCRNYQ